MGYGIFLMGELAREKGLIDKELEYDLMFETIEAMFNDFNNSTFSLADKSEYDCIVDYLDYIKINPKDKNSTTIPSDKVLDSIISELNIYAESYNQYEYGLPNHIEYHVTNMRNIIKGILLKSK